VAVRDGGNLMRHTRSQSQVCTGWLQQCRKQTFACVYYIYGVALCVS